MVLMGIFCLFQSTLSICKKATATGSCTSCFDGYFLTYKYPKDITNDIIVCAKCMCGSSKGTGKDVAECKDYKGCTKCGQTVNHRFFLQYQNDYSNLSSQRKFSFCKECPLNCLGIYSCQDHKGCTQCEAGYIKTLKLPVNGVEGFYYCYNKDFEKTVKYGILLALLFFCVLPIIIITLIILCVVKCVKGSNNYGPPLNSSVSQPVYQQQPIYNQPVNPGYTQPQPDPYTYQQQGNPSNPFSAPPQQNNGYSQAPDEYK